MTIQDKVKGILAGVGTTYPLSLPENPTLPATVYQFISEASIRSHSGNAMTRYRVQVSCWAKTYAAAVTLANSVKAALDLNTTNVKLATKENSIDDEEVETGMKRQIIDFFVWD